VIRFNWFPRIAHRVAWVVVARFFLNRYGCVTAVNDARLWVLPKRSPRRYRVVVRVIRSPFQATGRRTHRKQSYLIGQRINFRRSLPRSVPSRATDRLSTGEQLLSSGFTKKPGNDLRHCRVRSRGCIAWYAVPNPILPVVARGGTMQLDWGILVGLVAVKGCWPFFAPGAIGAPAASSLLAVALIVPLVGWPAAVPPATFAAVSR